MQASDIWPALAAAAPGSRVVLRLADGREIDVDRIEHFAGLVVVTPADGVTDELPATDTADLNDFRGSFDASGCVDEELIAILEMLPEFSIESAANLREKLERADKFYTFAHEAGDAIKQLADLMAACD